MNPITERVTDGAAVGAVSSPFWLHFLTPVSEFAALVLPIVGALWIVLQIIYHLRTKVFVKAKVQVKSTKGKDEV